MSKSLSGKLDSSPRARQLVGHSAMHVLPQSTNCISLYMNHIDIMNYFVVDTRL